MMKSLIVSGEPKFDTINELNRISINMNDNFRLMVSDGYCVTQ